MRKLDHLRWKILFPSLDEEKAWVKVGATSLELTLRGKEKHIIPFDSIEISEVAGVIVARRNLVVVAHLKRDSEA